MASSMAVEPAAGMVLPLTLAKIVLFPDWSKPTNAAFISTFLPIQMRCLHNSRSHQQCNYKSPAMN